MLFDTYAVKLLTKEIKHHNKLMHNNYMLSIGEIR